MKKNIVLLLISLVVFAVFIGCDTNEPGSESSESIASETTSKEETVEVVVVKDSSKKLEASQESKKDIQDMMQKLSSEGFYSAAGHDFTLKHVQEYLTVSQIREVSVPNGSNSETDFYSVHDCSEGGRLFVFYYPGRVTYDSESESIPDGAWEDSVYDYHAYMAVFTEKDLSDEDFKELKTGISTIEDVGKIDPATSFNFFSREDQANINWYVSGFGGELNDNYSVHFIPDGYILIGYEKVGEDFIVSEIKNLEYPEISAIKEIDWLH